MFEHIDLEEFRYPVKDDKEGLFELRGKKSGQSNPSVPDRMIRDISRVSLESTDRRKRGK